jgi:hypothetical protein
MTEPTKLAANYAAEKEAFYRGLHQPRFLKGWLSRNREVLSTSLNMIKGESA